MCLDFKRKFVPWEGLRLKMKNVTIKKTDNIEYLQFNKLLEFQDELIHAYTLKTFDFGLDKRIDRKKESLKILADTFNFSENDIIQGNQKHTDNVVEIRNQEVSLENTDGLITDRKQKALLTATADCICFLIYDPQNKVIANIHSGWKGTTKRIIQKAIYMLIKDYNCKHENIICCIGPALRKDHFLVNQDVLEIFENEFADYWRKYAIAEETDLENEKGKQLMLKELGIIEKNIVDSEICTMCKKDMFYSYRVYGKDYKNNIGLIMKRK